MYLSGFLAFAMTSTIRLGKCQEDRDFMDLFSKCTTNSRQISFKKPLYYFRSSGTNYNSSTILYTEFKSHKRRQNLIAAQYCTYHSLAGWLHTLLRTTVNLKECRRGWEGRIIVPNPLQFLLPHCKQNLISWDLYLSILFQMSINYSIIIRPASSKLRWNYFNYHWM